MKNKSYREPEYLHIEIVEAMIPIADERGVSKVARGRTGFVRAFKSAKGNPDKLSDQWRVKRRNFVVRHEAQVEKNSEPLFDDDGNPTNRLIAFVIWAYCPRSQLKKVLSYLKLDHKFKP